MSGKAVCLLAVTLIGPFLYAQGAMHYPLISHADLPLYPPIARGLNLTGTVDIHIIVTKGSVVDAQIGSVVIKHCGGCTGGPLNETGRKNVSLMLSTPTLANVKTWHFQSDWSGALSVTYIYRIQGKESVLPENPTVQFDLPVVTVTARPFKPTVLYSAAP